MDADIQERLYKKVQIGLAEVFSPDLKLSNHEDFLTKQMKVKMTGFFLAMTNTKLKIAINLGPQRFWDALFKRKQSTEVIINVEDVMLNPPPVTENHLRIFTGWQNETK